MKIIASDYDGTLNHGGIDDIKRNAIKKWRSAGNLFGLVSGRGADDLVEIPKKNNFECDFLLASNGAVILKPDGTVVSESRCDRALVKPLLEFLFEIGCNWASVHTAFRCIIDENDEERLEDEFTLATVPEIPYFNQISTILPDFEAAERVTKAVAEKFAGYLNPLQNGRCIDIVSADMNKAKGLYNLLEIAGAEYDDMITVGDNINDTHMIAEFRSYAMENAVQSIKEIADYETPGITELIEKEINRR
ncbi:MAG: HAD-IIB family hydrolase [Clostridia bacterium]|nr:HAD-IIB family hydrolase [Clostridia bacterium]